METTSIGVKARNSEQWFSISSKTDRAVASIRCPGVLNAASEMCVSGGRSGR